MRWRAWEGRSRPSCASSGRPRAASIRPLRISRSPSTPSMGRAPLAHASPPLRCTHLILPVAVRRAGGDSVYTSEGGRAQWLLSGRVACVAGNSATHVCRSVVLLDHYEPRAAHMCPTTSGTSPNILKYPGFFLEARRSQKQLPRTAENRVFHTEPSSCRCFELGWFQNMHFVGRRPSCRPRASASRASGRCCAS